MPGDFQMESARLRRDVSLLRRRRLIVYAAAGATGLTAMLTLIAATTIPGKVTPVTPAATLPDQDDGNVPVITEPGLNPPAQPPRSGFGGGPVAVSGGS